MRRRDFIKAIAGSAAAWPLVARAQQTERMRRVSVLMATVGNEGAARDATFRLGLERRGWTDSRNVRIDRHLLTPDFSSEQAQKVGKELIALQPDVIVVQSTLCTTALQQQTRTVPIVFVNISDPIGSGFAASLARPGGNLTGLMQFEGSVAGKWIGMLKEITPRLQRVAVLHNPDTTTFYPRAAEALAPSLAAEVVSSAVKSAADIERAIQSFARTPGIPDAANAARRARLLKFQICLARPPWSAHQDEALRPRSLTNT
jgi:putative ABC transport system substrate-binding protein